MIHFVAFQDSEGKKGILRLPVPLHSNIVTCWAFFLFSLSILGPLTLYILQLMKTVNYTR